MLAMMDKGELLEAHRALWAPFMVVGEGAMSRRLCFRHGKNLGLGSSPHPLADICDNIYMAQYIWLSRSLRDSA